MEEVSKQTIIASEIIELPEDSLYNSDFRIKFTTPKGIINADFDIIGDKLELAWLENLNKENKSTALEAAHFVRSFLSIVIKFMERNKLKKLTFVSRNEMIDNFAKFTNATTYDDHKFGEMYSLDIGKLKRFSTQK